MHATCRAVYRAVYQARSVHQTIALLVYRTCLVAFIYRNIIRYRPDLHIALAVVTLYAARRLPCVSSITSMVQNGVRYYNTVHLFLSPFTHSDNPCMFAIRTRSYAFLTFIDVVTTLSCGQWGKHRSVGHF